MNKEYNIDFFQLCKVRRSKSHLESYNKPVLNINYDHLAKVLEAKAKALKST
tara:strand:+ start:316 stop:471 length:156 start_codon:yes stop_codon:yes gene_type:complete